MSRPLWRNAKLNEVVISKKGKKPKRLESTPFQGSIAYIDIEAFEKGIIKQYADSESTNLCNENDVLVVWDGARFGLVGWNQKGAVGSTLMCLTPNGIKTEFLRHYLEFAYPIIQSNPKGMATPHVNPDLFWNMEMQVPPVDEQERIIRTLDGVLLKIISIKLTQLYHSYSR